MALTDTLEFIYNETHSGGSDSGNWNGDQSSQVDHGQQHEQQQANEAPESGSSNKLYEYATGRSLTESLARAKEAEMEFDKADQARRDLESKLARYAEEGRTGPKEFDDRSREAADNRYYSALVKAASEHNMDPLSYAQQREYDRAGDAVKRAQQLYDDAVENEQHIQAQIDELGRKAAEGYDVVTGANTVDNSASIEALNKQLDAAQAATAERKNQLDAAQKEKTGQDRMHWYFSEYQNGNKDIYGSSKQAVQQLTDELNQIESALSNADADRMANSYNANYQPVDVSALGQRRDEIIQELEEARGRSDVAFSMLTMEPDAAAAAARGKAFVEQSDAENRKIAQEKYDANMRNQETVANLGGPDSADYADYMQTQKTVLGDALDVSYKRPTEQWTQDQIQRFYVLVDKYGLKEASDYAAEVNRAYNEQAANEKLEPWREAGRGTSVKDAEGVNKLFAALSNAHTGAVTLGANVLATPFHLLSYADKVLTTLRQEGYYTGRANPWLTDYINAQTQGRSEGLNKDYGVLPESAGFLGSKGLGDMYQLVISAAQSAALGNVAGETATLLSFFGQAADSSFDQAIQMGMPTDQAMLYSFTSGCAEIVGEKFSLEALLKGPSGDSVKELLKYTFKQSLTEGSEEAFTNIINAFGDMVSAELTNNRSEIESKVDALVSQGMNRKDAENQVLKEFLSETAFDAVGGFFSGALGGGMQELKVSISQYTATKQAKRQFTREYNTAAKTGEFSSFDTGKLSAMYQFAQRNGDQQTQDKILAELTGRFFDPNDVEPGKDLTAAKEELAKIIKASIEDAVSRRENKGEAPAPEAPAGLQQEQNQQQEQPAPQPVSDNRDEMAYEDMPFTVGEKAQSPASAEQPAPQPVPKTPKQNPLVNSWSQQNNIYTVEDLFRVNKNNAKSIEDWKTVIRDAIANNSNFADLIQDDSATLGHDKRSVFVKAVQQIRAELSENRATEPETAAPEAKAPSDALVESAQENNGGASPVQNQIVESSNNEQPSVPASETENTVNDSTEQNASDIVEEQAPAQAEEEAPKAPAEAKAVSSSEKGNEYLRNDAPCNISFHGNDTMYHSVNEAMSDPSVANSHSLEDVVRAKFQQNRELRQKLFATGDQRIDPGTEMGAILESVRDELRAPDSVFNDVSPYDGAGEMNFNQFADLVARQAQEKENRKNKLAETFGKENTNANGQNGTADLGRSGVLGGTGQGRSAVQTEAGRPGTETDAEARRKQRLPGWANSQSDSGDYGKEVSGREQSGDAVFDSDKGRLLGSGDFVYGYGSHRIIKAAAGTPAHFVQSVLAKAFGVANKLVLVSGEIYIGDSIVGTVYGASNGRQIASTFKNSGTYEDKIYGIKNAIHEITHDVFNSIFGGYVDGKIQNYDKYFSRKESVRKVANKAFVSFDAVGGKDTLRNLCDFYLNDGYLDTYKGNGVLGEIVSRLGNNPSAVTEALRNCVSEEVINDILGNCKRINKSTLSPGQISQLRGIFLDQLSGDGIFKQNQVDAIRQAHEAIDAGDFLDVNGYNINAAPQASEMIHVDQDEVDAIVAKLFTGTVAPGEAELGIKSIVKDVLSGNAEAISELTNDELGYAINFALKKYDPNLDIGEKRRSYNAIANMLSGFDLNREGNIRGKESLAPPKGFGSIDQLMSKGDNKLYRQATTDLSEDSYLHNPFTDKRIGKYQKDEGNLRGWERKVVYNAIKELENRGLDIWGNPISEKYSYDPLTDDSDREYYTDDNGEYVQRDDDNRDFIPEEYTDADESSDEYVGKDEEESDPVEDYLEKKGNEDLRSLREGTNWLEGKVGTTPEVITGRDGRKYQGWYDIYEQSLKESESAKQRVMKYRAAQTLSDEIIGLEQQAAEARDAVDKMVRNDPHIRKASKEIYENLDLLNQDIEDLHAVEELFRTSEGKEAKDIAEFGSRLVFDIESRRNTINELGERLNFDEEVFRDTHSIEIERETKYSKKLEAKIESKRKHLNDLRANSRGGNTSGAIAESRRPTAFDDMPDSLLRQFIRDGEVSKSALEEYYGDADRAEQVMSQWAKKIGTKKYRVPDVHKLTTLEKSALHRIIGMQKAGSPAVGTDISGIDTERYETSEPQKIKDAFDAGGEWSGPPFVTGGKVAKPKSGQTQEANNIIKAANARARNSLAEKAEEDARKMLPGENTVEHSQLLSQMMYTEATSDHVRPGDNSSDKSVYVERASDADVSERNLRAYQESTRTAREAVQTSKPSAKTMDRLNKMFAERLGIENRGNTAVAVGTPVGVAEAELGESSKPSVTLDDLFESLQPVLFDETSRMLFDENRANKYVKEQNEKDKKLGGKGEYTLETFGFNGPFVSSDVADSMRRFSGYAKDIKDGNRPVMAAVNMAKHIQELMAEPRNMGWLLTKEVTDSAEKILKAYEFFSENKGLEGVYTEEGNTGTLAKDYARQVDNVAESTAKILAAIATRSARTQAQMDMAYHLQNALSFREYDKKSGYAKQLAEFWKSHQLNPADAFKMLDNNKFYENGPGYQLARMLQDGLGKEQTLTVAAQSPFQGLRKEKGFDTFAGNKKSYTMRNGISLSEQEMVSFIMLCNTLYSQKVWADGNGKTRSRLNYLEGLSVADENGKDHNFEVKSLLNEMEKGSEKKYAIEDILLQERDAMMKELSPAARKYIEIAGKVLNDIGKQVSSAKQSVTGVGFDVGEPGNFFPVEWYENDHDRVKPRSGEAPGIFDRFVDRGTGNYGYLLVKPAAKVVDDYLSDAIYAASYGDLADTLSFLNGGYMGTKSLTTAVEESYGRRYADVFGHYVDDVNRVNRNGRFASSPIFGEMRKRLQSGALSFSLSVPIKQVASYWDAAGVISPQALLSTYRFKGPGVKMKGGAAGQAAFDYRSIGNWDPTMSEILGNDGLINSLKKESSIKRGIALATNTMDLKTVDNLFTATVLDTKMNFPDVDVNSDTFQKLVSAKFQEVVLRTQPVFNKNARAEYMRTNNELERAASMFRTQQTQNFNKLLTTVGEYKAAKGTEYQKMAAKELRQTVAGQLAGAVEFGLLSIVADFARHKLKPYRKDEDDDTIDPWKIMGRWGLNSLFSASGTGWFVDQAAKALVDIAMGDKSESSGEFYGLSLGPISAFLDSTSKLVKDAGTIVNAIRERDFSSVSVNTLRNDLFNAATVTGFPVNNIANFVSGAAMYALDAVDAATDHKSGNRGVYDNVFKMFDDILHGKYTQVTAQHQADKFFRKGDTENLLYNINLLSSDTDPGKKDKGRNYLLKLLGGPDPEATAKSERNEYGRSLTENERIMNYLTSDHLNNKRIDELAGQYATSGGYNVLYKSLRSAGLEPEAAVDKMLGVGKTALSTTLGTEDDRKALLMGKHVDGPNNDIPALNEENLDEYTNFVSAIKVFEATGDYESLDKIVAGFEKLNENTQAVLRAKSSSVIPDGSLRHVLECAKLGINSREYYGVKDAIKEAQRVLDKSSNTGTAVRLVGLQNSGLSDKQIEALLGSEWMGISKTGKACISIMRNYGMNLEDIGRFMNHAATVYGQYTGTALSAAKAARALEDTPNLTDPQRIEIYNALKRNKDVNNSYNNWYNYTYQQELNYIHGKTSSKKGETFLTKLAAYQAKHPEEFNNSDNDLELLTEEEADELLKPA